MAEFHRHLDLHNVVRMMYSITLYHYAYAANAHGTAWQATA